MKRPCSLRLSGSIAIPSRAACLGPFTRTGFPSNRNSPASKRSAPKIARATSVRPLPTSPASPTISPARTVERDILELAPAAEPTRLAAPPAYRAGEGSCGGTRGSSRGRSSPPRASRVSPSCAGAVRIKRPFRIDGDRVANAQAPPRGSARRARPRYLRRASARTVSRSAFSLVAGQCRGRLVHQQEPRVPGDCTEDLDLLLVGGTERAHEGLRFERETRSAR